MATGYEDWDYIEFNTLEDLDVVNDWLFESDALNQFELTREYDGVNILSNVTLELNGITCNCGDLIVKTPSGRLFSVPFYVRDDVLGLIKKIKGE